MFVCSLTWFSSHPNQIFVLPGKEGLEAVADFVCRPNVLVASLNVSDNYLDLSCIPAVERLLQSDVRSLNLSDNDLTAKGGMAIVQALEENSTLEAINIGRTGFDSGVMISLCDMLRHQRNTTLNSIGLSTPYVSKRYAWLEKICLE